MHHSPQDPSDQAKESTTEPDVIFSPLSPERYCHFYDVEMENYAADLPFYFDTLTNDMDILEVGCGSGRIARAINSRGSRVTGIDISREMLFQAKRLTPSGIDYICMDMADITLNRRFDAVIAAYNTMNLLANQRLFVDTNQLGVIGRNCHL